MLETARQKNLYVSTEKNIEQSYLILVKLETIVKDEQIRQKLINK
jgi:hypothetical protein